MLILIILVIIVIIILYLFKYHKNFVKQNLNKIFIFFTFLIFLFLIKKIFFKNNTNNTNKIILKKEEKCISCIDAKIKVFFMTLDSFKYCFCSYNNNEKNDNINLISEFNNQMLNFLKNKEVYNLTEEDLLNLEESEIVKKFFELYDLEKESFLKYTNFMYLYFDYLEILDYNFNINSEELKLLEEEYLIKIKIFFN